MQGTPMWSVDHDSGSGARGGEVTQSHADLIKEIRGGSQAAATALYARYRIYVLVRVRRRLNAWHKGLDPRIDAEDVAQDVWTDIYDALKRHSWLREPIPFAKFLHKVTADRCRMAVRAHICTQCRAITSEETWGVAEQTVCGTTDPAEAVAAEDWLVSHLHGLPSLTLSIMVWHLRGHSAQELARAGYGEVRTIQRMIRQIKLQWQKEWNAWKGG
jgi:DNA-directed RNA polymerase specialized sigma24 family protein